MSTDLPTPESPVLSTLHEDGSRRWLYPRPAPGSFLRRRRMVAYLLIAVFTILPYVRIHGKPSILLNIPAREFTLFGFTFLPTDTLLLALFLLTLVMAYVAVSDRSFAVEPDYYQKALHWDSLQSQLQANSRLGWNIRIDVSLQTDILQNRDIRCTITDRSGNPVEGANVELVAFPHARGIERSTVALAPAGSGCYGVRIRMSRGGLWEFRIAATRGADVVARAEQQHVDTTGVPAS
ncbi:MAG: FixH family protein [Pirellulaceae bacterium]